MSDNIIPMNQRLKPKTVVFVRGMLLILVAMAGGQRILINADGEPYMQDYPEISASSVRFFMESNYIEMVRCSVYHIDCFEINMRGRAVVADWARGELKEIAEQIEANTPPPVAPAQKARVLSLVPIIEVP